MASTTKISPALTIQIPRDVKPMLATLVDKPLEDNGWMYELKWDGFRALAYLENGNVEIRSRNNKSFNDKFYPLYNALKEWKINAVVDGEIIVANEKGFPDFEALQTWRSEADGHLVFYVFDILWLEGKDLMHVPLKERKRILNDIVPNNGKIHLSKNFDATGEELFHMANKMGLEGIIAKKADSFYCPDIRSRDWLKIKTQKHQEAVIGGYTINEGTSKKFSSLLMGIFENGEFVSLTTVGTGFNNKMQIIILDKLKPLETKTSPFKTPPEYNKPSRFRPNPPKAEVIWVKPEVVAEISFRTVATDGSLRHPSFKGLREDKNAKEVVRETPVKVTEVIHNESPLTKNKVISTSGKQERRTLLNPTEETQTRNVNGHELKFPNLGKIFWPEENVTKRDMLNFYYQMVPYILPYMMDRPQTLNRFPNGYHQASFYQKDVTGKVPDWIEKFQYYSFADQRTKNFMVCTEEASLLYIAALGCIEMNPWSSRRQSPDHPDWCIIDLDPDRNSFEQVIQAACVTKQVLDSMEVPSFPKTSGSTGMHIYIPLGAKYSYEESKEFGRAIAKVIHAEIPKFTSIERLTANRKGKLYIDFLQNRPQATVATAYSLRPKPGAPVSMPVQWDEVRKGLTNQSFNIFNASDRVRETGDLFKGVLGEGIDMAKALEKLKGISGKSKE